MTSAQFEFKFNSEDEANQVLQLAFGRILNMGSRKSENGDIETYEYCKSLMMSAFDYLGFDTDRPKYNLPNTEHNVLIHKN